MNRVLPAIVAGTGCSRPGATAGRGVGRQAFTIVELLVVIAIMIMLLTLAGAAVSGARASQKRQATQLLISKLAAIVQQQLTTYASRNVITSGSIPSGMTAASYRAWYIRRNLITGDLPDRWTDVAAIASGTPATAPQRTYQAIWDYAVKGNKQPSNLNAGAECLFMIVMQGGIANCLDCGELRTASIGDTDKDPTTGSLQPDGFPEFLDAWGNPIGFILWPAGLMLPAGSGKEFFASDSRSRQDPFPTDKGTPVSPALGMRPLIYSAGPDGKDGFDRWDEKSQFTAGTDPVGRDCANWTIVKSPDKLMASPKIPVDAVDNITNFDAELVK